MNKVLYEEMKKPALDINRDRIIQLVGQSGAFDDELIAAMNDAMLTRIVDMTALYLIRVTEEMADPHDKDNLWGRLTVASHIREGLHGMILNPGLLAFTQALMVVVVALTKEAQDGSVPGEVGSTQPEPDLSGQP